MSFFWSVLLLALTDVRSFSACVAVQFFACISTVIDVASHRPSPTPFGTQHAAFLLAAWSPVVVFGMFRFVFHGLHFHYLSGHLPSVVRNLIPWRELNE